MYAIHHDRPRTNSTIPLSQVPPPPHFMVELNCPSQEHVSTTQVATEVDAVLVVSLWF